MDAEEIENLSDLEATADNAPDALRLLRQVRNYRRARHETPQACDQTEVDSDSSLEPSDFCSDELPDFLGRYELIRLLGAGGFAYVVLARDTELDRLVALKVPKAQSLFSAKAQQRFFREARLAASLSHPAIVPVFEFGVADRLTYICYEYCAGDSLADYLANRPDGEMLDQRFAARIGSRIAESMEHAHKRGVIHRDLKPSNVMLVPEADTDADTETGSVLTPASDDFASRLRVTDFGSGFRPETNELLTADGSVVGTPAYMSPEQAIGSRELTPASDTWSIGVILYELVTRQLPFSGDSAMATLMAVSNDSFKSPSKIVRVERDLEAIILKCLNRDPGQRYKSAFDLMTDLDRFVDGQTVVARKATWIENTAKWAKRNPLTSVAATVAFASLTLGFGVSAWQWSVAEHNRKAAVEQKDLAVFESQRADKNLERVQDVVDSVLEKMIDSLEYSPHLFEIRTELSNEMLVLKQELVNEAPDDARTLRQTLEAYRYIIKIHGLEADYEKIKPEFLKAHKTWRRWKEKNGADIGEEVEFAEGAYVDLAIEFLRQVGGSEVVTGQHSDDIQAIIEKRLANNDQSKASKVGDLRRATLLYWLRGKSLEGLKLLDKALSEFKIANKHAKSAIALFDAEDPPNTEDSILDNELAIRRHDLTVQNSIGVTLAVMGDRAGSRAQYERVAADVEKLIADHPQQYAMQDLLARVNFNLGNDAYRRRDWQASAKKYKKSGAILAGLAAKFPQHQNFQVAQIESWTMAATVTSKMQHESVIADTSKLFEKSLEVANGPKESPRFVSAWLRLQNNYARFLSKTKQFDKSLNIYLDTIRQAKELPHELIMFSTDRSLVLAHTNASFLLADKDLDAAEKLMNEGIIAARLLVQKYPRNPIATSELARALGRRIQIHIAKNKYELVLTDAEEIAAIGDAGAKWLFESASAYSVAYQSLAEHIQTNVDDEDAASEYLEKYRSLAIDRLEAVAELGLPQLKSQIERSGRWSKLRESAEVARIVGLSEAEQN
jgi:serine/threonine protein kinase